MTDPNPEHSSETRQSIALPLFRPIAGWVLLVLNIAIYVVPEVLGISNLVQQLGAKDNSAILAGEYYRFLTAMFLHAGLTHIGFNAFALYSFGFSVERYYGTARFVAIYFLSGFAGGIASYALSPNPSLGASGAIFGLVGALGAFFYRSRGLFGDASRQQIGSLLFVVMINLAIGFTTPRIDNYAHIGGLICGGLAGLLLAPMLSMDRQQQPPTIVRHGLSYGWPGAAALLLALIAAVAAIKPPLR